MPHIRSPSSSPARKRQRLSSPTYDTQFDLFDDEDEAFQAIEEIELSQSIYPSLQREASISTANAERSMLAGGNNGKHGRLNETFDDSPFDDDRSAPPALFQSAARLHAHGAPKTAFQTASSVLFTKASNPAVIDAPSSSPDDPPERDWSSWFAPGNTDGTRPGYEDEAPSGTSEPLHPLPLFQTAKSMVQNSAPEALSAPASGALFAKASALLPAEDLPSSPADGPSAPPPGFSVGFQKASRVAGLVEPSGAGSANAANAGLLVPSAAALEAAAKRLARWEEEAEPHPETVDGDASTSARPLITQTPRRPILRSMENSFSSPVAPDTPCPPGESSSSRFAPLALPAPRLSQLNRKPFKSPLLVQGAPAPKEPVLPTPVRQRMGSVSGQPHPLSAAPITATPTRPAAFSPAFTTPQRPLGLTPRRTFKTPFKTPFKPGMAPGDPGRQQLEQEQSQRLVKESAAPPTTASSSHIRNSVTRMTPSSAKRKTYFDLTKHQNRQTMASSGLEPQAYTATDLTSLGINLQELRQITPTMAVYYSFHSTHMRSLTQPGSTQTTYGPAAALQQLLDMGCTLATKPWVDNHWGMILWKLAGLVCLEPEREGNAETRRWCWREVWNQLLYRYERELNSGLRPAFKLITTRDVPATYLMVLCISHVTWQERGLSEDGIPLDPWPELEVTDGWYRLRAQVDEPLARATRRGILRVGRKIAIVGARLHSERKEPCEVLDAYNSVRLQIFGNSSHMAPWHAKLGFQRGQCIVTLDKLTPDGGAIPMLDVVVIKSFPIAYIETIEEEDGSIRRDGPRGQAEESQMEAKWQTRREVEESRLRVHLEKRLAKYEGWAERLERRAGTFHPKEDDTAPDYIEDVWDELENAAEPGNVLQRLTGKDAGWLARFIGEQSIKEREKAAEDIEQELKAICPPREVRNFRVVVVKDTQTLRRTAHRQAQLTVWDVLSLSSSEDGETTGSFSEGERFLVTNLQPNQQSAWMTPQPDAEIYLSTTRNTKWTRRRAM